jgi:hypothetical protein
MLNVNFAQSLVMNEIFSRGAGGADLDWIEIYNPAVTQVDLTGYKIYDEGGNGGTKPKKVFPASTIIPAGGFYVIVTDEDGTTAGSKFGLSSGGEQVWLENSSGTVIDTITFPAMPIATTSYGRLPDGGTNKQIFNNITRGTSNGTTGVDDDLNSLFEYKLNQNYPNPFNPTTTISYIIPKSGLVTIKVFNILGKEVSTLLNEFKASGSYSINFNAAGLSSGVYFYKITANNFTDTKKFTLLK